MPTPISDEELAAFLQEAGLEEGAEREKEKERNLEQLLAEIQDFTQAADLEEPSPSLISDPPPFLFKKSFPAALALIAAAFIALSLGLSCYLLFALNREIHILKELHVELEKVIEKIPSPSSPANEISEEKLLEELNPSFPEEEIIEPLDLLKDFSVA